MNKNEIWAKALQVWQTGSDSIKNLSRTVERPEFYECVKVLADCKGRIIVTGAGTSAMAARKIAHSLSCIERPAFFLSPTDAVHGGLGSVQGSDIAILISKGGNTTEMINIIPALKKKKVFIIGVTEDRKSALARHSDLVLGIKVDKEADDFNMLATTSTLAVIAAFDAICICLMSYTKYTKEQFAVIHPGGAVGEKLLHGEKKKI